MSRRRRGLLYLKRNVLVQLLHEASIAPNAADYRVLDCFGYFRSTGQIPGGGRPIPIIGFVFRLPDWANRHKHPTTVHKLLENSFKSDDAKLTPGLGARFQLARQLAN
ncbi:hypothetical protein FHL15_011095 [Xylaria flabelliformis]|uniref:Uncharacterized protein n=1 Tax=Xylaria flabelliformis TaxID=2512241 RepID=A0A553HJ92_9PEZI|nr:hypothetical protein FHL15_011095 [Xylaria flabelliformis]